MGKKIAPANKNPHSPSLKHVKMWLNHANRQVMPIINPIAIP